MGMEMTFNFTDVLRSKSLITIKVLQLIIMATTWGGGGGASRTSQ